MFCQGDEAYEHPPHTAVTVHLHRKSSDQEKTPWKHQPFDLQTKTDIVDKYLEPHTPEQEDALVGEHENYESRTAFLKAQRHQLEKDVFRLQNKLQQEVDLHYALENAFRQKAGVFTTFPNLPVHAQELVTDVVMLEEAISDLEERIASLNWQLGYEWRERQREECTLFKLPMQVQDQEAQLRESSCIQSPNDFCSTQQPCCSPPTALAYPLSPRLCNLTSPSKSSHNHKSRGIFTSPAKQGLFQNFYTGDNESGSQSDCLVQNAKLGCKHFCQQSSFFSPEKLKSKRSALSTTTLYGEMASKAIVVDVKNFWRQPNKLSQEMVICMVSIYQHLADPIDSLPTSKRISSSTSLSGNTTASSLSESSFMSFTRSPPINLQNKDIGTERSFDPYKTTEKLPWADIGIYGTAIEVSEMCIGKEQLEYAAEALRMFRSLVEQLSRVNPSSLKHEEKLAFWINVYNALMMHAYLAYGVPKSDFKFFSLMQKAAYTVGGRSFNAVVIEHLLLKAKAQWYKPQIALLLAHQKLKLREEVSMFGIDRVEPLVTFSLSFGASSSPAVRVYTAENVHEELQSSLQDYARASVRVSTRGKLLIPKLLFEFGCDLVGEGEIVDWICQFLPCQQSSLMRNCLRPRQNRFLNSNQFAVIPFDFRFQYLFLLGETQSTEQMKT